MAEIENPGFFRKLLNFNPFYRSRSYKLGLLIGAAGILAFIAATIDLDDGADLDVVARQDLRRQLDDLAAEGHRKKNMKTLADLVEAGLDNT